MTYLTRFAPSPTGPLHLGHAFSALTAFDRARARDGQFLLRIEDIDQSRARPEWEAQILDDLRWLGLDWPKPVLRQSDRLARYRAALDQLTEMGLTYPCRCNRADIERAASAPQEGAPKFGPDGRIYPGTCRGHPMSEMTEQDAIRLDMAKATEELPSLTFHDTGPINPGIHPITRAHLIHAVGDIVLARRGMGTSYHLSVVVDDADQGITEVTRGADLFDATYIHVLLQNLLGLPKPTSHHHRLIRDEAGHRLAKRDHARALSKYRADGYSPTDIRLLVGL
ncbi:tRNA glutamyl-Q(34) synthetase GluQRS [Thalassococcus sp. S3]|uniref:tRNA glutamyl-Q(34) synthetase GluQRS n=1 Tax=Thalassococcus sp. S3 TaxID=2017482 RepID=UPI001024572D|nr:tRNA glutamyl-Q(34) synthetase GluQRS [Thalassococcus sp. S3]QBF31704.1 tRNA glutamyl-Q(34) synthetase GluQRS [Thalassococcus sp. S3]